MPSPLPDCQPSVVVCASREGTLLHRTLSLLTDGMADALKAGFRCELLVMLHDADDATAALAHDRRGPSVRVVEMGSADRIEARNAAVRRATGTHMAWLDAGDVCSRGWLRAAAERAVADGREAVWHPEQCVVLDDILQVVPCHDQELDPREPATFFWTPPYPYAALSPRSLHLRFPFRPHDPVRGYLGGDWPWAVETMAAGVLHKTVPDTLVGVRPDAPPDRVNLGPPPEGLRLGPARRG